MMTTHFAPSEKIREEKLILAGQRGDAQAVNLLFCRHHKSLFHSALRIMGNPEDAEDALQEGLLSAFRNLKSFEGRSQISTWLTRIVINAALQRRRSLAARPTIAVAEPISGNEIPIMERLFAKGPTPEQLFGRLEILTMIRQRIEELPLNLRTVFVLRIVREHKTAEAARILGVTANTVKARLWRARRQLATRLNSTLLNNVTSPCNNSSRFAPDPPSCD
jgi:RNA polymerase sigma-70 factor (ECF subfamily)